MAFASQSDLQTAIANWLNRTDLTSIIPDFITLCEQDLEKEELARALVRTTLSVAASPTNLPADYREMRAVWFDDTSAGRGPLQWTALEELAAQKARYGATGVPRYCAALNNNETWELHFAPAPDTTYTLNIVYDKGLDKTVLLSDHPDVYLFGSLVHAEGYLHNDKRVALWRDLYETAKERMRTQKQRQETRINVNLPTYKMVF